MNLSGDNPNAELRSFFRGEEPVSDFLYVLKAGFFNGRLDLLLKGFDVNFEVRHSDFVFCPLLQLADAKVDSKRVRLQGVAVSRRVSDV